MKITEEELIEELEHRRDSARRSLKNLRDIKIDEDCFGVGYHSGLKEAYEEILQFITGTED